jgi:ubiquinone/menaquinone biosynthesis C-methylase UbiE
VITPSARPAWAGWRGYDDVVGGYDRFLGPNGYAALATDLAAVLDLRPGASVLDVGCGTGAVALAARRLVGPGALVAGVDVSAAMLRHARGRGAAVVGAAVPSLPFRDGAFDAVAASLVLSHVNDVDAALRDMIRVLAVGGRLGVTAGAARTTPANPVYQIWEAALEASVGRETLREAMYHVLPQEAWLTDPANLVAVLEAAGLEAVRVDRCEHAVTMSVGDYLAMLEVFLYGRLARARLGEAGCRDLGVRVAAAARARGIDRITYAARFLLGVGTKGTVLV